MSGEFPKKTFPSMTLEDSDKTISLSFKAQAILLYQVSVYHPLKSFTHWVDQHAFDFIKA